jgi:hypothetical protein
MRKKLKLKEIPEIKNPIKKIPLKLKIEEEPRKIENPIYFSGFALTDNLNYILFHVNKQFILDNFIQDDILEFIFSEESVDMQINRNVSLNPIIQNDQVEFTDFGLIKRSVYDLVIKHSPIKNSFFPVLEWFGEAVNSLICCLSDGKMVAVVKTT